MGLAAGALRREGQLRGSQGTSGPSFLYAEHLSSDYLIGHIASLSGIDVSDKIDYVNSFGFERRDCAELLARNLR